MESAGESNSTLFYMITLHTFFLLCEHQVCRVHPNEDTDRPCLQCMWKRKESEVDVLKFQSSNLENDGWCSNSSQSSGKWSFRSFAPNSCMHIAQATALTLTPLPLSADWLKQCRVTRFEPPCFAVYRCVWTSVLFHSYPWVKMMGRGPAMRFHTRYQSYQYPWVAGAFLAPGSLCEFCTWAHVMAH